MPEQQLQGPRPAFRAVHDALQVDRSPSGRPSSRALSRPAHDLAAVGVRQVAGRSDLPGATAGPSRGGRSRAGRGGGRRTARYPGRSVTNALTTSPATGSGTPITPASTTAGCSMSVALDLERADQVAGRLDDVVGAPDEPEPAVGVAADDVAGEVPAVGEARSVALVVVQVAAEHRRPPGAQRELAVDVGTRDLDAPGPSRTAARPSLPRRGPRPRRPGAGGPSSRGRRPHRRGWRS